MAPFDSRIDTLSDRNIYTENAEFSHYRSAEIRHDDSP